MVKRFYGLREIYEVAKAVVKSINVNAKVDFDSSKDIPVDIDINVSTKNDTNNNHKKLIKPVSFETDHQERIL